MLDVYFHVGAVEEHLSFSPSCIGLKTRQSKSFNGKTRNRHGKVCAKNAN